MKNISLSQGKFAIVDDADFEWLSLRSWHFNKGYAVGKDDFRADIFMHRIIMNTPEGMETDHINGNRLDNRRENLRICTRAQNAKNSSKHTNNTSGYKGVFRTRSSKWKAQIQQGGSLMYLGTFDTPEEAACAYDEAAKKFSGEYARLNFGGQS